MQLSLIQETEVTSNQIPPRLEVWQTLGPEQRNELLELLARVMARAAAASAAGSLPCARKERPNE